jgi:hypothetical protein
VARGLLPKERINICLRWGLGRPEIWFSPGASKAHYKRLMVCGSVWFCPVCASKITERRRAELEQGNRNWKGSIFLTSFTQQHSRQDDFGELTNDLIEGLRSLRSGRWYQTFEKKYGIVGDVNSLDATVSQAAGWHPHKHFLFYSTLPADQLDREAIETELSTRFIHIMEKRGRYVSAVYGVKVETPCDSQDEKDQALKLYVAKWGLEAEIAKGPVKNGRVENGVQHYSPFQLLELAGMGDKQAAAWFIEYAKVMKGRKQLVWSRGLRELLGLNRVEKSDEELAQEAQSEGDVLLAQLNLTQWRVVLANDARAELLDIADSGDAGSVWIFLEKIGAGKDLQYPPWLGPPKAVMI